MSYLKTKYLLILCFSFFMSHGVFAGITSAEANLPLMDDVYVTLVDGGQNLDELDVVVECVGDIIELTYHISLNQKGATDYQMAFVAEVPNGFTIIDNVGDNMTAFNVAASLLVDVGLDFAGIEATLTLQVDEEIPAGSVITLTPFANINLTSPTVNFEMGGVECHADFTGDEAITAADLLGFLAVYTQNVECGSLGDFNHDGVVSGPDLTAFLGVFGSNCDGTPVNGMVVQQEEVMKLAKNYQLTGEENLANLIQVLESFEEPKAIVYPNPANQEIFVNAQDLSGEVNVQIYDFMGRLVLTERLEVGISDHKISLETMNTGTYLVTFKNASGTIISSSKIVKQ